LLYTTERLRFSCTNRDNIRTSAKGLSDAENAEAVGRLSENQNKGTR